MNQQPIRVYTRVYGCRGRTSRGGLHRMPRHCPRTATRIESKSQHVDDNHPFASGTTVNCRCSRSTKDTK